MSLSCFTFHFKENLIIALIQNFGQYWSKKEWGMSIIYWNLLKSLQKIICGTGQARQIHSNKIVYKFFFPEEILPKRSCLWNSLTVVESFFKCCPKMEVIYSDIILFGRWDVFIADYCTSCNCITCIGSWKKKSHYSKFEFDWDCSNDSINPKICHSRT